VSVDLDALQSGEGLSKERLQDLYETQRQQQNQPQWGFQEDLSDMIAQESRKRIRKEEERRGKR
jgi:splicing factor 3B subunit 2